MNLLSAPGYSGAAIIADGYGRAVGYMGKRVNSKHQSYAANLTASFRRQIVKKFPIAL
jgi:hypothetical protein